MKLWYLVPISLSQRGAEDVVYTDELFRCFTCSNDYFSLFVSVDAMDVYLEEITLNDSHVPCVSYSSIHQIFY